MIKRGPHINLFQIAEPELNVGDLITSKTTESQSILGNCRCLGLHEQPVVFGLAASVGPVTE